MNDNKLIEAITFRELVSISIYMFIVVRAVFIVEFLTTFFLLLFGVQPKNVIVTLLTLLFAGFVYCWYQMKKMLRLESQMVAAALNANDVNDSSK